MPKKIRKQPNGSVNNFIFLLLTVIIVLNLFNVIWDNKDKYFKYDYSQRYSKLENIYKNSQYVNKKPLGWIPDELVNAYAGGAYIKGVSPILIAPDTPPLGRYLIGISINLFNNENIIILACGLMSLIFLYLLAKQVLENTLLSLLTVALFSFEPIFKNQFIFVPLLDTIQLSFLLPCFYFFNKGLKSQKKAFRYYFLSGIMLGAFISVKFFITGLTVAAAGYAVLLLHKKWRDMYFYSFGLLAAAAVLLINYIQLFFQGYSVKKFFGVQKWIFLYHKSQLILPFSIWPLLLLNRWYVWYGNKPVIQEVQWRISWPIALIISLLTIVLYFLRKIPKKTEFEVLALWTVFYILFFSFGQVTARYLVIYIPILYIVGMFGIFNAIKSYKLTARFKLWKIIR